MWKLPLWFDVPLAALCVSGMCGEISIFNLLNCAIIINRDRLIKSNTFEENLKARAQVERKSLWQLEL